FWCCTGTGMENPARYNSRIFQSMEKQFYVHLFISARLENEEDGFSVKQETNFPSSSLVKLTVEQANNIELQWKIRKPYWLSGEMTITINGEEIAYEIQNGYASVKRVWEKGDVVEVNLPMDLHLYTAKDNLYKKAILYGPKIGRAHV